MSKIIGKTLRYSWLAMLVFTLIGTLFHGRGYVSNFDVFITDWGIFHLWTLAAIFAWSSDDFQAWQS